MNRDTRYLKSFQGVVVAALFFAFNLLTSCSLHKSKDNTSYANTPNSVKIETASDPQVVEVDQPDQFPLVKIETRKVADTITANGVVAYDVNRAVPVASIAGGRVLDIKARLGDDVRQGQVLLIIDSPDLASALADYRRAVSAERLAEKAYNRTKSLYEHKAAPLKDVQQAEEDLQKTRIDRQTAAERIRIMGGQAPDVGQDNKARDQGSPQISPLVQVTAPVTGTIVEQNTTRGAAVKSLDNSPNLFTIADLSRVWALCDLYENNLSSVRVGDYAEVSLNAYPDRPLKARVGHISRVLDPVTRTAKVRLELDNSQGLLRPGMFAVARFVSRTQKDRTVVPMSAILRLHDKNWVFVAEGGRRFRRTEVQTGPALDSRLQEVISGLKPGNQIVENALQFSSTISQREGT